MNYKIKTGFIILFMLITVALLILNMNYVSGYNISIYNQIPVIVWILFIIVNISGIIIVLFSITKEYNILWKLGIFLVILINTIVLFLPVICGYQYNIAGDQLTHMGYIIDISNTGHIYQDIYPIMHILTVQVSLLFSISLIIAENIIGYFFYLLFIVSVYLLSREIFNEKVAVISALSSTILFFYFYVSIFPFGLGLLFFTLIYLFYIKHANYKKAEIAILLFLLILVITFFHPVIVFLLIIALLIIEIGKILFNRLFSQNKENISGILEKNPAFAVTLTFALTGFIFFNLWLWGNYLVWDKFISGIVDLFTSTLVTEPIVSRASESLNNLGFSFTDTIELFLKMYGPVFIYAILSIVAILPLFFKIFTKKFIIISEANLNERNFFLLSLVFVFFSLLSITDFVKPLTSLNSGRFMYVAIILFPVFGGLTLYSILKIKDVKISNPLSGKKLLKLKLEKIAFVVVVFIIVFSSTTSIFSLHISPITKQSNIAVTNEQIDGVKWIIDNGNSSLRVSQLKIDRVRRYVDSIYGISFRSKTKFPIENYTAVPDHFNYTYSSNFGNQFIKDSYLITRQKYIINLYDEVYPQLSRFTKGDFTKLTEDYTVNKIYENGEVQSWYVTANK